MRNIRPSAPVKITRRQAFKLEWRKSISGKDKKPDAKTMKLMTLGLTGSAKASFKNMWEE